jgi:hypothetical protein
LQTRRLKVLCFWTTLFLCYPHMVPHSAWCSRPLLAVRRSCNAFHLHLTCRLTSAAVGVVTVMLSTTDLEADLDATTSVLSTSWVRTVSQIFPQGISSALVAAFGDTNTALGCSKTCRTAFGARPRLHARWGLPGHPPSRSSALFCLPTALHRPGRTHIALQQHQSDSTSVSENERGSKIFGVS